MMVWTEGKAGVIIVCFQVEVVAMEGKLSGSILQCRTQGSSEKLCFSCEGKQQPLDGGVIFIRTNHPSSAYCLPWEEAAISEAKAPVQEFSPDP